jgi:hypothetical protein
MTDAAPLRVRNDGVEPSYVWAQLDDVMVGYASGTNLSTGENMPACCIRY